MNRFCLICKFLSVLFLISNESRTQARQMADSLMKGHEYALAAVYYEKALFDQNHQVDTVISENFRLLTNTLLNQKIQCQKALRTFEDAWQTAQRFDLNEPNDTLQFKLRYEGALCGYLSQRYNEAYGQIQQTRFYTRDTTLTASLDVLEIQEAVLALPFAGINSDLTKMDKKFSSRDQQNNGNNSNNRKNKKKKSGGGGNPAANPTTSPKATAPNKPANQPPKGGGEKK